MAGEWNGVPFQPHTLEIAGSTPAPATAEWLDGEGSTFIRCNRPVRIRLLQGSVPNGHDKKMVQLIKEIDADRKMPADEKEKYGNDLHDDLQTAQRGRKALLVPPGTRVCHACARKADQVSN